MKFIGEPTERMTELLRKSGDLNPQTACAALDEFIGYMKVPLSLAVSPKNKFRKYEESDAAVIRQGVIAGDILDFYQTVELAEGDSYEFPTDLLAPGTEKDFYAYTIPLHGRIPERTFESDYVKIHTYSIGNSIDWLLKYARKARWDVINRAMQVYEGGFVKKKNDDGFQTLLYAAYDRNIMVYDDDAATGQFTKRLVSLMKMVMRRNGGGNSTSANRSKLTDIYMSPEGTEDMRNWNIDQVDEVTRRQIFLMEDGTLNRIFGVNIHDLDEFGVNQEYQLFFTGTLAGQLGSSNADVELVIGIDRTRDMAFVNPTSGGIETFNDPAMHRAQRAGIYGWITSLGYGVLDSRAVVSASF